MSERLLRFLLSELETIRIRCCGSCKTIIEMPLSELARKQLNELLRCPYCHQDFDPLSTGKNSLVEFAKVASKLNELKSSVQLEFVLREPSRESEAK
jgi:hypothetical protein